MDRRGFTLIELLVVLGIMLVLLSLTATAFVRANRVDRLSATKDLVSDLVRQARATARSSGEPVRLVIEQAAGSSAWAVRGVTQTRLVTRDFETPPAEDTSDTLSTYRTHHGSIGQGFLLPVGLTQRISDARDRVALAPRERLRSGDGFVLAVDVLVPTTTSATLLPLVLLGPAGNDEADQAAAGLRLLRYPVPVFENLQEPQLADGAGLWPPQQSAWMLQGWVRDQSGTLTTISAWMWPMDPAVNPWHADATKRDEARLALLRHGGDVWRRCGLLWDGQHVRLLMDGQPIAERPASGPLADGEMLRIGHTTFVDWPDEIAPGRPDLPWRRIQAGATGEAAIPPEVLLDQLTLDRLGTGDPHPLPGGVVGKNIPTLLFWPQGRITSQPPASGDILLTFTGVAEDADTGVTLTVEPSTGAITTTTLDAAP